MKNEEIVEIETEDYRPSFVHALLMLNLETNSNKESASLFRKFKKRIVDDGFEKIQTNVYVRLCKNDYSASCHIDFVKSIVPIKGEVRTLKLVNNIYNAMETLRSFEKTKKMFSLKDKK